MLRRLGRALLVAMLVFAAAPPLSAQSAAAPSQAAARPAPPPPLSYTTWLRLRSNPGVAFPTDTPALLPPIIAPVPQ